MFYLIFFNKEIIILYLGEKYQESGIIFAIFTLTLFIRVNNYSDIIISAKKNHIILISYIISFFINIILNLFLIKYFGIIGASISTIITLIILAGIQLKFSVNLIGANILSIIDVKKICILILISISLLFFIFICTENFKHFNKLVISSILFFPIIYIVLIKIKYIDSKIITILLPEKISKFLHLCN
jgi:O-antigen/teichoic acid export membrane protein